MSGTLNKIILIGNLGKDPEVRYMDNKKVIARFSIATEEVYIDTKTNEKKKSVDWHQIVCWNQVATFVDNHVKKGMKVYIEGRLKSKNWRDEQNFIVYQNEIFADSIQIISFPIDSDKKVKNPPYPKDDAMQPSQISNKELFNLEDDDILPF